MFVFANQRFFVFSTPCRISATPQPSSATMAADFSAKVWTWTLLLLLVSASCAGGRKPRTIRPLSGARVERVRTAGLSCSVTPAATPCIYADRKSELVLTVLELPSHKNISVALTAQTEGPGTECSPEHMLDPVNLPFDGLPYEVQVTVAVYVNSSAVVPDQEYHLCLNSNGRDPNSSWIHQGAPRVRVQSFSSPVVLGIRTEGDSRASTSDDGTVLVPGDTDVLLRLFGLNFLPGMSIALISINGTRDDTCHDPSTKEFVVQPDELTGTSAKVTINVPGENEDARFYLCARFGDEATKGEWKHQGDAAWMVVVPQGPMLPLWLQIALIILLLTLSGLFSGLNLGLMALDRTDLKIIQNTGTENEKKYAKTIAPVRSLGNYLLCTLLLGNVLVNSSLTILLDNLTSGVIAIVGSTLGIVLFGEIIPQAICSRHGLVVGAHTVWITKFFMLITFPLSFPISKLLDLILGEEIGNVYNRERLKELIQVTKGLHDLQIDEVNIISGALEMSKKCVCDVMTKLSDVFMLPYDSVLDFQTMSHIMKQGYTRIPIYEGTRTNIIGMLNIKDLAFVDPDDNTPLKNICQFYNHPVEHVFHDVSLAFMLNDFKKGKSHLAIVDRVMNQGEVDPYYETIGVVTLEDVIEEIIQSEIVDETDVLTDNIHKRRRAVDHQKDFSSFAQLSTGVRITPQMTLAAFQYLTTAVEPFQPKHISESVLRKLMKMDVFHQIKVSAKETASLPEAFVCRAGKPTDFFVLVLEGRAQVTIGKENLVFECGPFAYFGVQVLTRGDVMMTSPVSTGSASPDLGSRTEPEYVPDYTIQAVHDLTYMRVRRSHYQAAFRATLLERQQKQDPTGEDPYRHMDKLPNDSLEHLVSSFRRTAPNSARSSVRSFSDLPGLASGLRSGSVVSPLAATPAVNQESGENACNGTLGQPDDAADRKEDAKIEKGKHEVVAKKDVERGNSVGTTADSLDVKDAGGVPPSNHVQNGQVTNRFAKESTL